MDARSKKEKSQENSQDRAAPVRLALRPAEAAASLGIGERLLWERTKAGEIPHMRLGVAVLYPVEALRQWLAKQIASN